MKKWLVMATLIVIGMCLTANSAMANDWTKIRVATEAEPMALTYGFLNTPKGKNFEFIGPTYSDPKYFGPISIALRIGNDDLKELLNKGLKIIRDNGTYQKINAKYFPFDIYGD